MGIFLDAQGQLTPQSLVKSGQNSNSSEILWLSLITCKYEQDSIKYEGGRVLTRSYIDFSDAQGAGYSAALGRIKMKFKLIQAFMIVLVTCKNEEDPIKNEGDRLLTTFLPL